MNYFLKSLIFLIVSVMLFACSSAKHTIKTGNELPELTEKQRYNESDLFVKAVEQRELGNLQNALELIDKALVINPEDPAALYEKARLLLALGRTDEAMQAAKSATNYNTSNKWYKALYANIAKANGNYPEYVRAYEQLVNENPNDLNFLNELAYAYYFTGKYQKAIQVYDKIEEQVGINESLTTQKVQLYDNIGKKDEAVAEYEKLIKLFPDESRYYALLAEYCSKNQMNDKAIWAYNQIVKINPEDPYVHISLADFYKKEGNDQKAFEELKTGLANPKLDLKTKVNLLITFYSGQLTDEQRKQALELSDILRNTHPNDPLSETFYASMLYENNEYGKSRELLKEIIKENSSNYGLWEQMLFCSLYLEDYPTLVKDSEDAVDLFPTYPLPYFFAGIANFQLKDYVKAKAFLESGKEFVVNNNALLEQFYSSLGDTYNELENYEASYAAYDKALSLNPENSIVLNNYAYYLSLRSINLDKAAKLAKKAVELDPYNENNLDTYSWVLYKQGKYHEALDWIKKAYNNGGDSSGVVLEHYGDIYFKLKKPGEALKYWKQAKTKKDYSEFLDKKIKDEMLYE
jgi:tetratricopeptide (TPR) repeat protein